MATGDTIRDGEPCDNVRYYILSKRMTARRFGTLVRSHWGVENSLHWQLDLSFDEDRNRTRKDHAAANLAVLRRIALSLLKRESSSQVGVKDRRLTAAWSTDCLHKVLFGGVFTVQSPCVPERSWHPSQVVEPTPDGGLIMGLELGHPREVERRALSWGPDCEVLAPAELRGVWPPRWPGSRPSAPKWIATAPELTGPSVH